MRLAQYSSDSGVSSAFYVGYTQQPNGVDYVTGRETEAPDSDFQGCFYHIIHTCLNSLGPRKTRFLSLGITWGRLSLCIVILCSSTVLLKLWSVESRTKKGGLAFCMSLGFSNFIFSGNSLLLYFTKVSVCNNWKVFFFWTDPFALSLRSTGLLERREWAKTQQVLHVGCMNESITEWTAVWRSKNKPQEEKCPESRFLIQVPVEGESLRLQVHSQTQ